jgi:hypothetical protein
MAASQPLNCAAASFQSVNSTTPTPASRSALPVASRPGDPSDRIKNLVVIDAAAMNERNASTRAQATLFYLPKPV